MEYALKDTAFPSGRQAYSSDSTEHGRGDTKSRSTHRFHNYLLAMDPMHYLRKGTPFTASMPHFPSSWMEQWPIGKTWREICNVLL